MSVPLPPTAVEGHCSAINDDTLYVLSPAGFLSLPLQEHAEWAKEANGVSVTGPACATDGDSLFVLGGTTSNNSYSGLQKYGFASKSWQTIPLSVPVLQGRTNHSAVYMQDAQSILVYAGGQPDAPSYLSSQTFLVSTQAPYSIQAYISEAPPTNRPILAPWDSGHAVMVGGSEFNTGVFTFSPSEGWQQTATYLSGPLAPGAQGTVVDGSDGSKVLEVYDMSVSPNNVTQIVLLGANGQPAYTGQTVGSGSDSGSSSRKRKRDLTLNDWPTYSDTNAPTATRPDYSLAQGSSGVAVIAGGSSAAPVALFNQNENSWVDADKFFDSKVQQPLQPSSTLPASTSSPTTSSSSKPSHTSSGGLSAHDRTLRTLGITLGVLCGIAVIFILVLLFLRWRKMKQRRKEGYLDEKHQSEARMSFQDRGASFMKEAGGSMNDLQPPKKNINSQDGSHTSLAIITGKFGSKRNTNAHQARPSYDSTTRLVKNKDGLVPTGENVEMMNIAQKTVPERKPVPRTEPRPPSAPYGPTLTPDDAKIDAMERRKRSSGWSKYFATSQPTGPEGLSHLPSAYVEKDKPVSDGSAYSTDRPDHISRIPSSALVPPLDIDFSKTVDGQRLSHVTMGRPSFNDSCEDLATRGTNAPEGQQGKVVDPSRRSATDSISSYNRSTMSSAMTSEYYNDSGTTPWTPTSTSFKDHLNSRPPSSVYEQRIPSRGKSAGFFPGSGASYRPSKSKMGHSAAPSSDWASPKIPSALRESEGSSDIRDSDLSVFPKVVAPAPTSTYLNYGQGKENDPAKPVNSDLGWLNLGLGNHSQNRL